ncbi:MAG: hypothetical protein EPN21_16945 [Methylococcaceae bacterium]|nr:MAG: hypothetical protein EPN21_16945 [Methylococcaceae bacterium]
MKTQRLKIPALFIAALLAALAPWPAMASLVNVRGDAMIVPGDATNYGGGRSANVRGGDSWMLLNFGKFAFPSSVSRDTWNIGHATLTFYVRSWNGVPGYLTAKLITSPWDEGGVTGVTPLTVEYAGGLSGSAYINGAGRWYTMNATPALTEWVFYRDKGRSIGLFGDAGLQVSIASKESGDLMPYLEVTSIRPPFYIKRVEFKVENKAGYTANERLTVKCNNAWPGQHKVIAGNAWSGNYGLLRRTDIEDGDFSAVWSTGEETKDVVTVIATCWNPNQMEWN